jgi:hypothetical protein
MFGHGADSHHHLLPSHSHIYICSSLGWDDLEKWPGGMPPITLTSTLIPLLMMFLKLVQIVLDKLNKFATETLSSDQPNAGLHGYSSSSAVFKHHVIPEVEEDIEEETLALSLKRQPESSASATDSSLQMGVSGRMM